MRSLDEGRLQLNRCVTRCHGIPDCLLLRGSCLPPIPTGRAEELTELYEDGSKIILFPNMNDDRRTLTTSQGHPVADNQTLRSVGRSGDAGELSVHREITHFDRQRFPSESSMRVAPSRTVGSNLSAKSARRRRGSSPGPRFRHRRACSSMASISRMTRCCRGRTFLTWTRSAVLLRHAALPVGILQ